MKFRGFKFSYLHVYFYLLHSKVHWQEREDAISEVLDRLPMNISGKPLRMLDIGCGPGLLVNTALKKGFSYLGMDTDQASIDYCREKYRDHGHASFTTSTIHSHEVIVNTGDIVILNGVMHHLDDKAAKELLGHLLHADFVIILDHYIDKTLKRWPKFLQKRDRGQYVRDYSFFKKIEGYHSVMSIVFPIKIFSLIFWMYFCMAYKPKIKSAH
ncbi:MAG: class I SAM-dependent methyltransferase [Smithella sp.]|jgi:2-polyprenyl-3-methyl-5-hydroxy-6-metoxy-1,4-benzoquinol methylase